MTEALGPWLGELASSVAAVATLRGLTMAAFALGSRRFRWPTRGLVCMVYGSLLFLAASTDPVFPTVFGFIVLGFGYFTIVAAGFAFASIRGWFRKVPRWGIALGVCAAMLVVPGVSPRIPGGAALLLAGWELSFATYSFVLETTRRPGSVTVGDGLFFLLVNPTVSYPDRGAWAADPDALSDAGLRGCAIGAGLLFLHFMLLDVVRGLPPSWGNPLAIRTAWDHATFLGSSGLRIARVYLVQAGVATLHLGILALMGFRAPPRFNRPWLATSPAEFWRRWNTYVGAWFSRYVFMPLSYAAARRRWVPPTGRTALAVMATFLFAGATHDAVWLLQSGHAGPGALSFGLQGGALLLFAALPAPERPLLGRRIVVGLRAVAFWHVLAFTTWLLAPPGA